MIGSYAHSTKKTNPEARGNVPDEPEGFGFIDGMPVEVAEDIRKEPSAAKKKKNPGK